MYPMNEEFAASLRAFKNEIIELAQQNSRDAVPLVNFLNKKFKPIKFNVSKRRVSLQELKSSGGVSDGFKHDRGFVVIRLYTNFGQIFQGSSPNRRFGAFTRAVDKKYAEIVSGVKAPDKRNIRKSRDRAEAGEIAFGADAEAQMAALRDEIDQQNTLKQSLDDKENIKIEFIKRNLAQHNIVAVPTKIWRSSFLEIMNLETLRDLIQQKKKSTADLEHIMYLQEVEEYLKHNYPEFYWFEGLVYIKKSELMELSSVLGYNLKFSKMLLGGRMTKQKLAGMKSVDTVSGLIDKRLTESKRKIPSMESVEVVSGLEDTRSLKESLGILEGEVEKLNLQEAQEQLAANLLTIKVDGKDLNELSTKLARFKIPVYSSEDFQGECSKAENTLVVEMEYVDKIKRLVEMGLLPRRLELN